MPSRRRVYSDRDVNLRWLKDKTCAAIGYGSQGRAQALNAKDSGLHVIVGLPSRSRSRRRAARDGFKVYTTPEAVGRADVLFLALQDTQMPRIYRDEIAPHLRAGQTLLFAHGFAIFYKTIVAPRQVDVVMVAPKGLGPMVRREFVRQRGVPGLFAVHRDFTGTARKTALAWGKAIGCTRDGLMETTFREETETDLFGEQAVLCGGVTALIHHAFETLVRAGYPAELAYFECLHELKFIVDLIHEEGIAGMTALISDTATWGTLTVGPRIVDAHVRRNMERALRDIRSGKFAREFIREMERGGKRSSKLLLESARHPIERVGRQVRGRMRWEKRNKK